MMNQESTPKKDAQALKGKTGLRRLLNATGYSLKGFKAAYANEAAFREEILLVLCIDPSCLIPRLACA